MAPSQVKRHLQRIFEAWGRPSMIRFDNGLPWGTTTAVPSALALWLVGLGIQPHFGRPRQSTDNAVVERAHGVLNGWVEPERCSNLEMLQGRLTHFARFQRERYPACQKQTRLATYPQLLDCPRPYAAAEEALLWSMQAVFDYLASFRFHRKVEVNGRFTLLSQPYSLGRAFKRRTLAIQMDPIAHQWVVYDDYGAELRRFAPHHLTYETIASLTLAARRTSG